MTTTQTQAKTSRMCDAAFDHIKGIHDDMGMKEAISVYQAQTTAFIALMRQEQCGGSNPLAIAITTTLVLNLMEGLI
jgi:hypothetical protein